MPLPPSGPRDEMHLRNIAMRGYRRPDGLYDIEGHITDTKTFTFQPGLSHRTIPPGEPIHEMWIRLTIDDRMHIHDAMAVTDNSPFRQCPDAADAISRLKGLTIGAGWQKALNERLGSRGDNCTHLREMLMPLATAAFQTLAGMRANRNATDKNGRPLKIDSCYAFGASREQVMLRWPQFHAGTAEKARGR